MMRVPGVTRRLREWVRTLANLPDSLRHIDRHQDARRQLAGLGRIERILVVCSGNVCRSPYLAALLARELPGVRIASAGFAGSNQVVPEHSLSASAKRGLDLSKFRSHSLQPRRARTADLVIVMEPKQAEYIARFFGVPRARIVVAGDLDPQVATSRAIQDPWRQSIEVFESCFDRLDRCGGVLTELLLAGREQPGASDTAEIARVPTVRLRETKQHLQPVL